MHAFEDLSPRKTDFSPTTAYVKETLPGAAVKVGPWMRTTQMVTLVLSVAACSWGTIFWRKLSDLPNYSQERPLMFNAEKLRNLSHLVLVAGHAVILADSLEHVVQKESDWYLEPYQRHQDLPQALVSHIKSGVELTAADPEALLIFSGGQTRAAAGPRDEGWSYYRLAEHFSWWGHGGTSSQVSARSGTLRGTARLDGLGTDRFFVDGIPVAQRTVTEDFALDSFQNLLFSFCRFKEVVGHYPQRVTVISFGFKKRRFAELHRSALRFPASRFSFVGIQPPPGSRFDLARAEQGELQKLGELQRNCRNSLQLFESDPYGCHSQVLVEKRRARNPFQRTAPYLLSCPEIKDLLEWCGPGIFRGNLPWTKN